MRRIGFIYAAATLGALGMGLTLPFLSHRGGSASVPGWTAFVEPGPLSAKHAFFENNCEACHEPHRGPVASRCIACHANSEALLSKQSTAFHATIENCSSCHAEHRGNAERPIQMDHLILARIAGGKSALPPKDPPPHSRISREELVLDCAKCHGNQDPHRSFFGLACASCHATTSWSILGYRHPSPDSTDCAQCHQAPPSHSMEHFKMVSMRVARVEHARVDQCFLCHKTNAWNDIRGVGWYKHH